MAREKSTETTGTRKVPNGQGPSPTMRPPRKRLRMPAPPTQPRFRCPPCACKTPQSPPWRQRGLFQRCTSPTSAEPVFLYLAPAGTGRGKDPVGGPPDWTPDWKRSVTLPLQNPKFPTQYPRARALGKETWLAAVNKGTQTRKKGSRRAGYHIPSLLSPNASWMSFAFYLVLV